MEWTCASRSALEAQPELAQLRKGHVNGLAGFTGEVGGGRAGALEQWLMIAASTLPPGGCGCGGVGVAGASATMWQSSPSGPIGPGFDSMSPSAQRSGTHSDAAGAQVGQARMGSALHRVTRQMGQEKRCRQTWASSIGTKAAVRRCQVAPHVGHSTSQNTEIPGFQEVCGEQGPRPTDHASNVKRSSRWAGREWS